MTTRERILNAAVPVFAKKGRHGAHMEEIASVARINKAMIYYIFHNKDDLYSEVLKHVFEKAREFLSPFTDDEYTNSRSDIDFLSELITAQLKFFNENRDYTKILVDAMSSGAEEIPSVIQYLKTVHKENASAVAIKKYIEKGKIAGLIRDIDIDQLMISMTGMIIVYFFTNSITDSLDIEVRDEQQFMEERRKSIIDLVFNGILAKNITDRKKKPNVCKGEPNYQVTV